MSPLRLTLFLLAAILLSSAYLNARDLKLGGSIRGYQFFRLEDTPATNRRDAELWILRLNHQSGWGRHLTLEAHGVLSLLSPPFAGVSRLALNRGRSFLPLDHDFSGGTEADLLGSLDRLNLRFDFDRVKVIVGRQAISWGVSHFWPSLDLFSPFGPQQIDRDYRAGVDALRVTLPLGAFSELEFIGAGLGSSGRDDGAAGSLLRLNFGPVDVGLMGGTFHRDTVIGGFFTSNLRGNGVKGELTWTRSGDVLDRLRERDRFWRGSVGMNRQLTPTTALTLEVAWNGFGTSDSAQYLSLLQADRILRGEVNALGKFYSGFALTRQLHPLLVLSNALLTNWNDRSVLWIPALTFSIGNNSDAIFGTQVGVGPSLSSSGSIQSEYGSVPNTAFLALQVYF